MTEYSKAALDNSINEDIRKIVFKVVRNVTLATPVDTGRARGNWQIAFENINFTVDQVDRSGISVINNALNFLIGYKYEKNPVIWINNNLPYIGKLNEGSSTQAPKKFVEIGIQRALND